MITVSELFLNYSKQKSRDIDIKIEISDGEEWLDFGKSEIIDFEIDGAITEGEDFSIGNVIFTKFTFGLLTEVEIEKNAVIKPFLRLNGKSGYTEWVQLGKYRIDNRKKQGSVWKFDCYDELIKAQRLFKTNLVYPTTSKQVLLEIMLYLDYEMDEDQLNDLPEFAITRKLEDYLYTNREVLGFLAQIYTSNIVMNNIGELRFVGVTDRDTKLTATTSEYVGLAQTNELKTITKVVVNMEGDREQISIGDGDVDNTLFLVNPIITEDILDSIYDNILDFTYVPLEIRNWRTFPYLECGDFIEFKQRDGSTLKTVIQINKLSFKGGLSGRITSPSKSHSQSEYGFDGNTNQIIGSISSRIGVYVLTENNSDIIVTSKNRGVMMLPVTALGTTDLEFNLCLIGETSEDTVLTAEIRSGEGTIGKIIKEFVKAGMDTVSCNFLVKGVEPFADNLILFLKVDSGQYTILRSEGQFYIYGANLITGSGIPYANVEDDIDSITRKLIELPDSVVVKLSIPIPISLSEIIDGIDTLTTLTDSVDIQFKDL